MSFKELEKEYERTGEKNSFDQKIYDHITMEHEQSMKQCESKAEKQEKLISDLEMIKNVKSGLLADIYMSIMGLPKIALKPDSAFMLQHLDFLIPRLREEGKEEWIKILEDLRKAGEDKQNRGALRHVLEFTRKEVNQKSETGKKKKKQKFFKNFDGKNSTDADLSREHNFKRIIIEYTFLC